MIDDFDDQSDGKRSQRLVGRLNRLVGSGRVTGEEADRVRAAAGPRQLDEVIRDIRVRHAGTRLAAAVQDGRLTSEEADGIVNRLRNGEHSRSLRAHLGRLRPGHPAPTPSPGTEPAGDDTRPDS